MTRDFSLTGDFQNVSLEPTRMWAVAARMVAGDCKTRDQLFSAGQAGAICSGKYSKHVNPSMSLKSDWAGELGLTCEINCPLQLSTVPERLLAFGPHWIFNEMGQDGVLFGCKGQGAEGIKLKVIVAGGPSAMPISSMRTWGRLDGADFRTNLIFRNAPWTGGVSDVTIYTNEERREMKRRTTQPVFYHGGTKG